MRFTFQATDQVGEIIRGEMDAPDKDFVFNALTKRGLTPIVIKPMTSGGGLLKKGGRIELGKLSALDKILLVKRLAAVLRAGIPVVESIEIIGSDTKPGRLRNILISLKASLERGETLAAGFTEFPKEFSSVFIGLIKAGENSGSLDKNLETLASYLKRDYEVKRNLKSAMFYPTILLTTSIIIVVIMVVFVLPRITKAFETSGIPLPFITRMFLTVSSIVSGNPIAVIGTFFAAVIGFFLFMRSAPGKRIVSVLSMRLPVISGVIKQLALSRFADILSSLLSSGLAAIEALEITAKSIGNLTYEREIEKAKENVKRGIPIGESLKGKPNLFPNVLVSMVTIGEKSGTLDETLKTLGEFYQEEVDRLIKNALTLIEPLMLLVMGGVVAFIAISILLPIYQLIGAFS